MNKPEFNPETDWFNVCRKFYEHFNYYCNEPPHANIFSEDDFKDFSELVDKCIKDDFDYTIEKCGTVPILNNGTSNIILD